MDPGKSIDPEASPAEANPSRSVSGSLTVLALAAAGFNVIAFPFIRASEADQGGGAMLVTLPIVVSVMAGQIGALAIWLLWGEGTFIRRLAIHWLVGIGLFGASCLGMALATADQGLSGGDFVVVIKAVCTVFCFFPAISLAAQLPLWPLVTYFGWKVAGHGTAAAAARRQPLSILDLLAGTGVVAVTLGLLRAAAMQDRWFLWGEVMPALIAAVVLSLFVMLPAVIFLLRWKEAAVGVAVFAGYLCFGLIALVIASTTAFNSGFEGEAFFVLVAGTFALAATVSAPLLVWRSCGQRLTWPRDRAASHRS